MVVVERDYNQLQLAGHPDLIIDAHTCILLVDVLNLQEKGKLYKNLSLALPKLLLDIPSNLVILYWFTLYVEKVARKRNNDTLALMNDIERRRLIKY